MNEDLRLLTEHVERLERHNRLYKRGALVLLFSAAAIVATAQAPAPASVPAKLEAQSFVLKDASGKERAKLEMVDGGPALSLLDPQGRTRALLDATYGGASLKLKNAGNLAGTELDDGGSIVAESLLLGNRKAHLRAYLSAGEDDGDSATLRFSDAHNTRRAEFSDNPNAPAARIRIFNDKGKVIWSTPMPKGVQPR